MPAPFVRQIFPAIASKGRRYRKIEDRYEIRADAELKIFAIYDGHAGSQISEDLCKTFGRKLHQLLSGIDPRDVVAIRKMIKAAFVKKDQELWLRRPSNNSDFDPGSTAVMAIYFTKTNRLFFAHSGDSRAVLYRVSRRPLKDGTTKVTLIEEMSSSDHKPLRPDEKVRIEKAGGHVTKASKASVERVDGILAVSRAFGDFHLKQNNKIPYDTIRGKVSSVPDVSFRTLAVGEEYRLFMASDGLWDEMDNTLLGKLAAFPNVFNPEFGKQLIRFARGKGGDDDITIIGLTIKPQ